MSSREKVRAVRRTFGQTIRCIVGLSSTREVGLQHGRGSPYFCLNTLHNLRRCMALANISASGARNAARLGRLTCRVQVLLMLVCREGRCVLESLCATRQLRADCIAGSLRFTCEERHEDGSVKRPGYIVL
jgi:hypothetical protein